MKKPPVAKKAAPKQAPKPATAKSAEELREKAKDARSRALLPEWDDSLPKTASIKREINALIRSAIRAAEAEVVERCAVIAETSWGRGTPQNIDDDAALRMCQIVGAKIRAGGSR